jgi:hypothetical protein
MNWNCMAVLVLVLVLVTSCSKSKTTSGHHQKRETLESLMPLAMQN